LLYGIVDGYNGLLKKDFEKLSTAANGEAVGILPKGGSIIGSSTNAFSNPLYPSTIP